ncbi:MAG: hypothetical protein A3J94_03850 [Syntrophus sp. RIFOXYC2_FULL_54_9]|nr:MAG: hypothetical protein A2X92_03685 [Syntrophus sp. GWC2_56_31]OHE32168.1 MAG: hypothetical protein A3J94_03850 [Syntrophus sp. RIFOXYC2_FULL_54_9]HBB15872.1 hypothetical protein [Syntrophus sp. (in: bacteria)]
MEKEQRCYRTIKAILSKHGKPPYKKEEIKSAITSSIREYDYISAITAYLWGAYNNFDAGAKTAFKEIFSEDLKKHDQTAFYFFSFYFTHDFKRTGFDRRQYGDRRESYSLDFFSETIRDLRKGTERRRPTEKRTTWTRVTEWTSVPFKATRSGREKDSDTLLIDRGQMLDQLTDAEDRQVPKIESLNTILSSLVTYYETHIQQEETEWMIVADEEIFQRAKDVMKKLIKVKLPAD